MAVAVPWRRSRGGTEPAARALLDGGPMPSVPLSAENSSFNICAAFPQVICTSLKRMSQTPRPVTVSGVIPGVGLLSHLLLHVISRKKYIFPVDVFFLRNIAQ